MCDLTCANRCLPNCARFAKYRFSSGILQYPGIFYPMGAYCSLQYSSLVHLECVYPTISLTFMTLQYLYFGQGNWNSHRSNYWFITNPLWCDAAIAFLFFNVESIHVFTFTFVSICFDTSYFFGFISIIKIMPLDILKFLVTTLRNQDKKVALIQVYWYRELKIFSWFMRSCHNMGLTFKTTGGD